MRLNKTVSFVTCLQTNTQNEFQQYSPQCKQMVFNNLEEEVWLQIRRCLKTPSSRNVWTSCYFMWENRPITTQIS